MSRSICGKTLEQWKNEKPILKDIAAYKETLWINPDYIKFEDAVRNAPFSMEDVQEASERLKRFEAYIKLAFPGTSGIIESPLEEIPNMKSFLKEHSGAFKGRLMLKMDSHLPISGSIKARGGIYEVLKHAEDLAIGHGLLGKDEDYSVLLGEGFRDFFSRYSIAVASTGNLGLSIGIMSAKLGFRVDVHMSADARQWKKDMLREKGARVIEYADDYSKAITEARKKSAEDENCYFIDDENSRDLFLGYAVAALRLQEQLKHQNIPVDMRHPLFVYLPCGVGGGPAGVAFGLKLVFGDAVNCFFAEPTHAPCMLLGLVTGCHDQVCVQDFGIDGKTCADGLAVGRPSHFAGKTILPFLSGSYTVSDERLFYLLSRLYDLEGIRLEPSALAGLYGPCLLSSGNGQVSGASEYMENATHIAWATGGSMVPPEEMEKYYETGKAVREENL